MEREVEYGNVEYKRKLSIKDSKRNISLISQIQWRLNEGNGVAIYCLGVNDDGSLYTFKDGEESDTLIAIHLLANKAGAKKINEDKIYIDKKYYYRVTLYSNVEIIPEKKILILGPPGCGKTSYLSYLVYGDHDNGNGYVRTRILRYDHECTLGTTMSLAIRKIGCNDNSLIIHNMYDDMININNKSQYLITFFDAPLTYFTSEFNLTKYMDHVLIMDCADTNKYINIVTKYNVPHTIVNYNNVLTPQFYNNIKIRDEKCSKLLFLNIISSNGNKYLISCINYNYEINIGDKFYSFTNINNPLIFFKVESMMYCDKNMYSVDKNITFTMTVNTKCNLKKYKRNFFFKT